MAVWPQLGVAGVPWTVTFARKGRSEGRGQGRRVRDGLLVDADADAEDADAKAHVAALPVVAATRAITVLTGTVARRRCPHAVYFSPARAWELV